MGRRSEHSLEQIREMALEAAEKILRKRGIASLSTRKIAAEIGYTSGTLYLVFKNLDDLLLHVNGRTLMRLRDLLSAAASQKLEPAALLHALCLAYLKFAQENLEFWSLLYERPWPADFKHPAWYQTLAGQCFAPMAAALRALDSKKAEAEVQQSAQAIWAMLHGMQALGQPGRSEGALSASDLVGSQLDVFLAGYQRGAP